MSKSTLTFVSTYGGAVLDALADPTRRGVLELVAQRPRSVTELAAALPVSRPAVSQHLRVLKQARLVVDRPAGTRRIYQLDTRGLAELRAYVDDMWRTALTSFAVHAQEQYGSTAPPAGAAATGALPTALPTSTARTDPGDPDDRAPG